MKITDIAVVFSPFKAALWGFKISTKNSRSFVTRVIWDSGVSERIIEATADMCSGGGVEDVDEEDDDDDDDDDDAATTFFSFLPFTGLSSLSEPEPVSLMIALLTALTSLWNILYPNKGTGKSLKYCTKHSPAACTKIVLLLLIL